MTGNHLSESRIAVVFSSLGHLYIHLCTAFYFVIVLSLEEQWNLPYHELIELWTLGSLLVGVAALPAGLLSDRIGASIMMIIFFVGMGGASIAAGLSSSPRSLMAGLAGIGMFAAIYHPVGIPWLVRNTNIARGKALGLNGVFGAAGSALAGLVAGSLIEVFSWRAAFIIPGIVCALTGVALLFFRRNGLVDDNTKDTFEAATTETKGSRRVFPILLVTMFIAGLIFHATQVSLPKFFEQRQDGLVADGAFGVGVLVAIVYGVAGLMQVLGGHLADRFWRVRLGFVAPRRPRVVCFSTARWTTGRRRHFNLWHCVVAPVGQAVPDEEIVSQSTRIASGTA